MIALGVLDKTSANTDDLGSVLGRLATVPLVQLCANDGVLL